MTAQNTFTPVAQTKVNIQSGPLHCPYVDCCILQRIWIQSSSYSTMKRSPICRSEAPTPILPNRTFRREKFPRPCSARLEEWPLRSPLDLLRFAKDGQNLRLMGHGS